MHYSLWKQPHYSLWKHNALFSMKTQCTILYGTTMHYYLWKQCIILYGTTMRYSLWKQNALFSIETQCIIFYYIYIFNVSKKKRDKIGQQICVVVHRQT